MNNINPEKFQELKTLFSQYDEDEDNYVNVECLDKMCLSLGININDEQKEMQILLDKYCVLSNEEYLLSFEKFLEFISARSNLKDIEDEIIETFNSFNKSGNGKISYLELKQALKDMGEEFDEQEIQEIFNWVESDVKDGLTYEDFVKIISNRY